MSKNIYQRINDVMRAVEYIKRDATVQNYKAVTHDMVTAVLRPKLVEHGIVVHLEQESGEVLQAKDATNKMLLYSGTYSVNFVNIENPTDRITVKIQAHANDNGDKAPGKAASYATKSAMLKLFSLETGENDESRVESVKTVSAVQIQELEEKVVEVEADRAKFLQYLKVADFADLRANQFDSAMKMLAKKGAK